MALIDDFKARFPEISTTIADTWVPIEEVVYPTLYGGDYTDATDKEAILNLIAHLIVIDSQAGSAPAKYLTSKSAGSISGSYASPSGNTMTDEFYRTTKYGQRFRMITRPRYGGRSV